MSTTCTKLAPDLYDRLVDRVRHAQQYAEAARLMVEDARDLLEAAKEGDDDDD
jgi:hypothetical protein